MVFVQLQRSGIVVEMIQKLAFEPQRGPQRGGIEAVARVDIAPPELQKMWEGIGCYKDVAPTELGSTMQ